MIDDENVTFPLLSCFSWFSWFSLFLDDFGNGVENWKAGESEEQENNGLGVDVK